MGHIDDVMDSGQPPELANCLRLVKVGARGMKTDQR